MSTAHNRVRIDQRRADGTYPAFCPECGCNWPPSMYESSTYPGSGCDRGECLCAACEWGDGCDVHDGGGHY